MSLTPDAENISRDDVVRREYIVYSAELGNYVLVCAYSPKSAAHTVWDDDGNSCRLNVIPSERTLREHGFCSQRGGCRRLQWVPYRSRQAIDIRYQISRRTLAGETIERFG